jgi:hypothetical protein
VVINEAAGVDKVGLSRHGVMSRFVGTAAATRFPKKGVSPPKK